MLARQFDMMGFVPTHRHPAKAITRYKQGRITLLLNAEAEGQAAEFRGSTAPRPAAWLSVADRRRRSTMR
jgi:4-hydroxyphenylpyruvate dioxygenase